MAYLLAAAKVTIFRRICSAGMKNVISRFARGGQRGELNNKNRYEYEDVINDPIIFYGFVKHVEVIGEAVYMLTKEFRETHPEVEWDVIEGMRHVLVHGYYKIRPNQLWNTIENDIPKLKPIIESYIKLF